MIKKLVDLYYKIFHNGLRPCPELDPDVQYKLMKEAWEKEFGNKIS